MPVTIRSKHGSKQYLTVAERVTQVHADHPSEVSIITEVLRASETDAVVHAKLRIGELEYHGSAHELRSDNPRDANFSAWVENCETSAIGRALASANYHGSEFASAEEIISALQHEPGSDVNAIKQLRDAKAEMKVAAETERELTKQLVALQDEVEELRQSTMLARASESVQQLAVIHDASERRVQLLNACANLVGNKTLDVIVAEFDLTNLSGRDARRLLMVCHLLATAREVIESE